jgi:hypothetical protein
MTVTFTHRDGRDPVVQLALGSETRTFELEFTYFWLAMVEEGRKAASFYLCLGRFPRNSGQEDRLDRLWIREVRGDGSQVRLLNGHL